LGPRAGESRVRPADGGPPRAHLSLTVREYRARVLGAAFLSHWDDLETRALDPNPFLSPRFAIPALQRLSSEADKDPVVLTVESDTETRVLGLGIFEACQGTRLLPLRHLRSWKSPHSLLDGVLLDRDHPFEVATALFRWAVAQGNRWHGFAFEGRAADTETSCVLESAASGLQVPWREERWTERAFILTCVLPDDCLRDLFRGKRRRELRRKIRKLEEAGPLSFKLGGCDSTHPGPFENFLEIEAMGWKGEHGAALVCDPKTECFAREMASRFEEADRLVCPELTVGGELVASALCLRSGEGLFGFRSGWNPRFRKLSPGVILKYLTMQAVKGRTDLQWVDSCSEPGSWVESIWPGRRRLTSGVFPTSPAARRVTRATAGFRVVKRRVEG
jgi:CelD/BcsL family acetyltransferase involved in cellulose biosynthesis